MSEVCRLFTWNERRRKDLESEFTNCEILGRRRLNHKLRRRAPSLGHFAWRRRSEKLLYDGVLKIENGGKINKDEDVNFTYVLKVGREEIF